MNFKVKPFFMNSVIIVGGGSGERMQSDVPKQFIYVNGKPIIIHTIEKFISYDKDIQIIVVIPESNLVYWDNIIKKFDLINNIKTVSGGQTRFHSVKNGLKYVNTDYVAIHDAVRPLVNLTTINNVFTHASLKGNAIPLVAVNESVRYVDKKNNYFLNRENIKIVQTPQCFNTQLIKYGYKQRFNKKFTDDASVIENLGKKIFITDGNIENIKITYPIDLIYFKNMICS